MNKSSVPVWVRFMVLLLAFIVNLYDAVPLSDKQTIEKERDPENTFETDLSTISSTDSSTSTQSTTEVPRSTSEQHLITNVWYTAKPNPQRSAPLPSTFDSSTTKTTTTMDSSTSTQSTEINTPLPSTLDSSTTTTTKMDPSTSTKSTEVNTHISIGPTEVIFYPNKSPLPLLYPSPVTAPPKLPTTTATPDTSASTGASVITNELPYKIEETIQTIHRVYHYEYKNESSPFKPTDITKRHLIVADDDKKIGTNTTTKKSTTLLKQALDNNKRAKKYSRRIGKLRNQLSKRVKRLIRTDAKGCNEEK